MTEQKRPTAIDPSGCGCTDCITGEHVPLNDATPAQIVDLLTGTVADNLDQGERERTQICADVAIGGHRWKLAPELTARLLKRRVIANDR